jgi:spore coat polysaccharide biosynthesis predicted glycosyltransferase SpsG
VTTSTNHDIPEHEDQVGIVVDAGRQLGYGHAVRCLRLAKSLARRYSVVFYPLSDACREFIESSGYTVAAESAFPPVVITDLREAHGITAAIQRQGSKHISIHDLGLAQCHSDIAIDGSITRLFPYGVDKNRTLFLGPQYMITRDPVKREKPDDTVLVTFGGGSTAAFAQKVSEELWRVGLTPITTRGFIGSDPMTEEEFAHAMATCRFAISGSGVTLYDLLASGIPTITVAFDRLQLRTADAFHEHGAVLNAGLIQQLSTNTLMRQCLEMIENRHAVQRLTQAGQALVDGKGLSRVVEIVRRQIWLTSQLKTFTAC